MPQPLVLDLVRHMKARNRQKWAGSNDERPLTKRGLRQAEAQAAAMAMGDSIAGLYCSPAMRCRQTIAPLAERLGLDVTIEPLLAETEGYRWPPGWEGFDFGPGAGTGNPIGAAYATGRGLAFVSRLQAENPEGGRFVACSHGDTIPVTVAALGAAHGVHLPPPLWGFGGWYRIRFDGGSVSIERFEAPEEFPG
jgi:8-oxo-dGTP diphosphatase